MANDEMLVDALARAVAGPGNDAARSSTHAATVTRLDPDGTMWVSIPGGADETPVRTSLVAAEPGDVVQVTIADGRATATGNESSPAANASTVAAAVEPAMQAAAEVKASLVAESAKIAHLEADTAKVHDLTADQLTAAVGYIDDLTSASVTAEQLAAGHATVGSLDANYAQIGLANVNTAQITNGVIQTASIVDEQVFTVSGNKATLAEIDASKINVSNLNADNITVNKINGQTVTGKSISDALSQHETDISTKVDTTTFNNTVEGLNDRIDGAIETFTGTVVPTLNNTPASAWNTTKLRDEHVGDVYYVVNASSQQNGYCYRFTKSGSTYSWQLIKDSDVTAALSRLQTAEGKITTFDSDISTLKTDTGELKTKTQSLETSLGDKVDVTTFNNLSSDVEENSATITTLSNTVSQKADSSTVTTLSNTVNQVKQTADTNKTSITNLTQTVNQKADSSTVTTLTQRTSTIEQNLNGITTRVGKTESTLETVSNPNLSPFFSINRTDSTYWHTIGQTVTDPDTRSSISWSNAEGLHSYSDLEGEWAHFTLDARTSAGNDGSKDNYFNIFLKLGKLNVEEGKTYTWLVEIRNATITGASLRARPSIGNATLDKLSDVGTNMTFSGDGAAYAVVTAKSDFSGVTQDTRGFFHISKSGYADFDARISIYEGEYSGPYKPYVDQTLSNRVKIAETSIEQNAEDITLRATKAEFDALSIGGTNRLINTANPTNGKAVRGYGCNGAAVSGGSLSYSDGVGTYTVGSTANIEHYIRIIPSDSNDNLASMGLPPKGDFVLSGYVKTSTTGNGLCRLDVRGQFGTTAWQNAAFTNLLTGETVPSAGSVSIVVGAKSEWTPFAVKMSWSSLEATRFYISFQMWNSTRGNALDDSLKTGDTFQFKKLKLEKGNKATDWTPAPEDMATAAELKVASDNIALKVSKNDVINQINVSDEDITIDAARVNIAGATIFTSGRLSESSLNNTYVADRHCQVGQSGSTVTNPWYKVASTYITAQYVDVVGVFDVLNAGGYGLNTTLRGGRLTAHVRAASGLTGVERPYLKWESRGSEINLSNFVLAYKVTSGSRIDIELWCRCDMSYAGYIFKVVYEGNRTTVVNGQWTLYNTWTVGSQAAITSGYTQLASEDDTQIGGRNIVYSTADYKGWLLDSEATASGDTLDINVSGQTANTFKGAKQWLTKNSADLDGSSIVLSFEVYSDDWASVTSERAAGLDSATVQIVSCPNPYGSSAPGKMARYRYLSLAQTNNWTEQPAQANGEWLRFVSVPIAMPSGLINTDQGTTVGAYLYVNPLVRRNGHIKFRRIKVEVGTKATEWTPAPEDVDAQIDAIQVGGRNLLRDTDVLKVGTHWYFGGSSSVTISTGQSDPDGGNNATLVTVNSAADHFWSYTPQPITELGEYTFSVWMKASATHNLHMTLQNTGIYRKTAALTTSWQRFTMTFDVQTLSTTNYLILGGYSSWTGATPNIYFYHPKLEKGNKVTDWSPAPEDTVKRTQRIYYRKEVTGAPAAPSSWVVNYGDGSDAWTQKHISISSADKYIYTCEQYEMADGTLGNTSILLDDTITVIDGGKILTGTVEANALKAKSLTLGNFTDAAANSIDNSKVLVGGRNLLRRTGASFDWAINTTSYGTHHLYSTGTTDTAYDGNKLADFGLEAGDQVTLSFDWATSQNGSNDIRYGTFRAEFYGVKADGTNGPTVKFGPTITMSASNASGHYSQTMTLTALTANTLRMVMRIDNSCLVMSVSNVKLEKGNKATDWTPAPEDVDGSILSTRQDFNDQIDPINESIGNLTTNINEHGRRLAATEALLSQVKTIVDNLEDTTSWFSFNENSGLIIGDNPSDGSSFFYTQQKGSFMSFNQADLSGSQELMRLSGTDGVKAPKVTSEEVVTSRVSSDWAIRLEGDMFSIDYIGS